MTTTIFGRGVASVMPVATANAGGRQGGSKIARGPSYSSACTHENENLGFGRFLPAAPYSRARARRRFLSRPFSFRT